MSAPVFTVVNVGDSTSFTSISYIYQYWGLTAADVPTSPEVSGPRTFPFRKTSPIAFNGMNRAVAGYRITNLLSDAAAIDALIPANKSGPTPLSPAPAGHEAVPRSTRKYILSVLIGSNPATTAGADEAAIVATYCESRRSAGWDAILVGTIWPRGDGIITDFPGYRSAYNALLRSASWQTAHGVGGCFDLAADPTIGPDAACENLTYFEADKVHPIQAGYAIAATIYRAALELLLTSLLESGTIPSIATTPDDPGRKGPKKKRPKTPLDVQGTTEGLWSGRPAYRISEGRSPSSKQETLPAAQPPRAPAPVSEKTLLEMSRQLASHDEDERDMETLRRMGAFD